MNDTTPKIVSLFFQMMMKKSGQERLMMGFSMFDMARSQVEAGIRVNYPDADDKVIRKEVFLRFYGHEFSPDVQEKILKRLLEGHPKS